MPSLDLTDAELQAAAMACRAASRRCEADAKAIGNPALRAPSETSAKRYAELAVRFEAMRRDVKPRG